MKMSQPDLAAQASNGDHGDNADSRDLPTGLVCPSCGSKLVRRSMRRTFLDRLRSLFGRWPYRCQMCNMRFTGPQDAASIARGHARLEDDDQEQGTPPDKPKG